MKTFSNFMVPNNVTPTLWVNRYSMWVQYFVACFFFIFVPGVNASPCDGMTGSLSAKYKALLAPKIAKELRVKAVDVLQSFRSQRWRIIYVDTHESDETFVFYDGNPLTSHYVTLWGGAATIYEEQQIEEWVLNNAKNIPIQLANCFAWHVTHDRDM